VQARRTQDRLSRSGVGQTPDYAAGWTWETLATLPGVDREALALARRFAGELAGSVGAPGRRGLYLYGRMGRGKTGMAVCALEGARAAGLTAGYVSLAAYYRALRRVAGGRLDRHVADEYDRLRDEVDVLVLDDLGVERPTGFVLEELYGLIEERAGTAGRWTIITSNYDLRDLVELWSEARGATEADRVNCARIAQRLRRHYALVEVLGENLRPAGSPALDGADGPDDGDAGEGGEEADDAGR
jgi:DNA replication protein DnaC